jgi:hypothetical protein
MEWTPEQVEAIIDAAERGAVSADAVHFWLQYIAWFFLFYIGMKLWRAFHHGGHMNLGESMRNQ